MGILRTLRKDPTGPEATERMWGRWAGSGTVGGAESWVRRLRTWGFGAGLRRTGGLRRLSASSLVEMIWRDGLRVGGIELRGLVEVDRKGILVELVGVPALVAHVEFGLGRPPGWTEEGGCGRLTDVGQDLGNGFGIGQERDECSYPDSVDR